MRYPPDEACQRSPTVCYLATYSNSHVHIDASRLRAGTCTHCTAHQAYPAAHTSRQHLAEAHWLRCASEGRGHFQRVEGHATNPRPTPTEFALMPGEQKKRGVDLFFRLATTRKAWHLLPRSMVCARWCAWHRMQRRPRSQPQRRMGRKLCCTAISAGRGQ